jgi:organic radical activating enzyme
MKHVRMIEYHITNHCNVNCKGCAHFSPLSEPWFADVEEFKKDLKQLGTKIIVDNIRLFGGEPLLHPNVCEFFKAIHEIMPNTKMSVLSNGSLLKQRMGEMINSLIEYDVLVEMTRYPINVNYEKLFALLNSVGVRTKNFNQYEKTKILRKHILTHEAKQTDFDCCMIHWKSMQLKDGKLYLCPIQAYIDIFNKYFNETYQVKKEDILDIYDDNVTDEVIDKFYRNKNDFCKYCRKPIEDIEWEQSKRSKEEWME